MFQNVENNIQLLKSSVKKIILRGPYFSTFFFWMLPLGKGKKKPLKVWPLSIPTPSHPLPPCVTALGDFFQAYLTLNYYSYISKTYFSQFWAQNFIQKAINYGSKMSTISQKKNHWKCDRFPYLGGGGGGGTPLRSHLLGDFFSGITTIFLDSLMNKNKIVFLEFFIKLHIFHGNSAPKLAHFTFFLDWWSTFLNHSWWPSVWNFELKIG